MAAVAIAAFALFGVACSGRGGDDAGRAAPIAECEAYAAQLRACFGREAPGAEHAVAQSMSLTRANDAERARMKAMCSRDLERLRASCH